MSLQNEQREEVGGSSLGPCQRSWRCSPAWSTPGLVLALCAIGCGAQADSPAEAQLGKAQALSLAASAVLVNTLQPVSVSVSAAALLTEVHVSGRLRCAVTPTANELGFLRVQLPEYGQEATTTAADGSFEIAVHGIGAGPTRVRVTYEGTVTSAEAGQNVSSFLQVMDEAHAARSEETSGVATLLDARTLSLGDVSFDSLDCELYRAGSKVLRDHHHFAQQSPPGAALRVLRWSALETGTPFAFYDYINIRSDLLRTGYASSVSREALLFHEFGHVVRDLADGDLDHWNWDNFRWAYARSHTGSEIYNSQYAFHEGWADYYASARQGQRSRRQVAGDAANLDWNENRIANRLLDLADLVKSRLGSSSFDPADRALVEVLRANPGSIHSLYEFERALARQLGLDPLRAEPAACPPGYGNDGATCRLSSITSKASYGRGVGVPPEQCGAGQENDAGLCYPLCEDGYHGAGPVCWQTCPDGYRDDGADCWGGFFDIIWKSSYARGAGTVPSSCPAEQEYDAGLCYAPCDSGYHGVGPVCWGSCPAGYQDDGATCSLTSILVRF